MVDCSELSSSPRGTAKINRSTSETGSLLCLISQLVQTRAKGSLNAKGPSPLLLMQLLGRYYQIRDDYMNLTSTSVSIES